MTAIADRAQSISSFIVMDVLERAQELEREGIDVVHLEVGEPCFDTPAPIVEAGHRAMRSGHTHYTHSLGLLELRETISEHYSNQYAVAVSPEQILVTSGTSPAMLLIFSVLLNPGDQVILSNPCYACYPNFIRYVAGVTAFVDVYESNGFQYTLDGIQQQMTDRTRGVLVNSPANPTGYVTPSATLEAIANLDTCIISDEIYHGLVYEGQAHSILEYTDQSFVINGFSKLYAMTGWRLGYVIAPPDFVRPMQKLQQNLFISAADFVQYAGIAALKHAQEDVQAMVYAYAERRKALLHGLRKLGLGVATEPTGAFYILANARHLSYDSYHLAFDILEKAHVAVTPGIDFGTNAEGYLRFSYTTDLASIQEGLKRLDTYLAQEYPESPR